MRGLIAAVALIVGVLWFAGRSTHAQIMSGPVPVPGQYVTMGVRDIATFNAGHWTILHAQGCCPPNRPDVTLEFQWGQAGDIPAVADYDGDGLDDLTVFRPSTGLWWVLKSSCSFACYVALGPV